jgi:hypothetical protein
MQNSRVIEVQRTLSTGGLAIKSMARLPTDLGVQIKLASGGIVNVFDTGKVSVQGKKTDDLKRVLGPLVAAPALGERECLVCRAGDELHVHHLDGNHDNNSPGNRVDLCPRCHAALHKGGRISATGDDLLKARGSIDAVRGKLGGSE